MPCFCQSLLSWFSNKTQEAMDRFGGWLRRASTMEQTSHGWIPGSHLILAPQPGHIFHSILPSVPLLFGIRVFFSAYWEPIRGTGVAGSQSSLYMISNTGTVSGGSSSPPPFHWLCKYLPSTYYAPRIETLELWKFMCLTMEDSNTLIWEKGGNIYIAQYPQSFFLYLCHIYFFYSVFE